MDRTGHDKKEIIAALEKAVSQLQECQSMLVSDYDKYAYNTIFEYELDEDGIEVAQQGIFEQLLQFPQQLLLDYVHLAAHVSNGLKPRIRPVVGRI